MESFECSGHIKSKWAFPWTTCIGILDIMCQRGWVQPESPIGLASFLGETIHGVCVLSTELALGFGRLWKANGIELLIRVTMQGYRNSRQSNRNMACLWGQLVREHDLLDLLRERTGSSEGCVMTTATATVLCDLQVGSDQNPCDPSSWPVAASWNSEKCFIEPRRAPISWALECPWPRAPFQRVGFANNHSNSKKPLPSAGWKTMPGWSCWLRCSWGHLKGQLKMVQHVQLQRL